MSEENTISLNAATKDELTKLHGIGEAKAQAIVDYRKEHGPFKNIEDVKNVKGIGNVTFDNIKDKISLMSKRELLGKRIKEKVGGSPIVQVTKEKIDEAKYKIENELLLAKENIERNFEHAKTVLSRKTAMKVALLEKLIHDKLNSTSARFFGSTDGTVSLNAATKDEFTRLNGIGDKKAQAIVDYRKEHGPFKRIEDIKNVKGINDAIFNRIKDKLTLYNKSELLGKKIKAKLGGRPITKVSKAKLQIIKERIKLKLARAKARVVTFLGNIGLLGKKLKLKIQRKNAHAIAVSKAKLALLKSRIAMHKSTKKFRMMALEAQAIGLSMQNSVIRGVKNVGNHISEKKYNFENKLMLAKEKIARKYEHIKTVIARKTAMEVALFKNKISEKFKNLDNPERLNELVSRIEALKEERRALLGANTNEQELAAGRAL